MLAGLVKASFLRPFFSSKSHGWSNQPGLKSPAQRLEVQLLKDRGTRGPLVPVRGLNWD